MYMNIIHIYIITYRYTICVYHRKVILSSHISEHLCGSMVPPGDSDCFTCCGTTVVVLKQDWHCGGGAPMFTYWLIVVNN